MTAETDNLQARLNTSALALGATHSGVADFSRALELATGGDAGLPGEYPSGISIGVATTPEVDDDMPDGLRLSAESSRERHTYGTAGALLDRITDELAAQLKRNGHRARSALTSAKLISHNLSSNLDGLGWIGKSSLMISRKYGPLVHGADRRPVSVDRGSPG